ncbi:MAG: hypothetical protein J0I20_32310 [Chloroflexi bacterium]|nr:hypothetical protein [Chloroflexota bacterium]
MGDKEASSENQARISDEEATTTRVGVCTIVAKNYLPYARTLMQSIKEHNPHFHCFVLLADKIEDFFDPSEEIFTVDVSADLPIPDSEVFHFKYSILELATAVKPFYLEYLFNKHQLDKLFYFDPDIMVFNDLAPLITALDTASIVLTPHLLDPLPDDGKRPSEREIMQAGVFNLGFIGLAGLSKTLPFIRWWQQKLINDCVVDIPGNLFVDQRWIDLVPGLFPDVAILRDPGNNVAYWNLPGRAVEEAAAGQFLSNGQPLRFFHFSGFDAERPEYFSKHQDRYTTANLGDVNKLVKIYRQRMLDNGYVACKKWPYAYGFFSDGSRIPEFCRRMVRDDLDLQDSLRGKDAATIEAAIIEYLNQPYTEGEADRVLISRLVYFIYEQRPDLRAAYPDLDRANRLEVAGWFVESAEREYKVPDLFVRPVATSMRERASYELALSRQYNFKQQAEESGAYAQQLEHTISDLQASLSWKITAPLRNVSFYFPRKNKV